MLKSHQFACVLSLMLALAHPGSADARPSSGSSSSHSSSSSRSSSSSFKSGFSSQRSAPAPSYASSKSSAAPASSGRSGGFGSFGRRPASDAAPGGTPDAAPAPSRSSGGFGSFGAGRPAPQKSDSALSQDLGRKAAEANALRTLDARRQAQADTARDTRPVPGYEQGGQGHAAPGYVPPVAPQQQAPVVVRQDSGLGHVVAGAVLANAMRGAHANNGGYPGNYGNTGGRPGHGGGGSSFLGLFMTLCVLALVAWGVYFLWRRLRRARDAKKPNYSFKEN